MNPTRILISSALAAATALYTGGGVAAQTASTITFTVFAAETQAALPGAQVSVDGRPRGVADARGELRVAGLAPGTHGVSVSLVGRIPRGMRLELAAGEEREGSRRTAAVAPEPPYSSHGRSPSLSLRRIA